MSILPNAAFSIALDCQLDNVPGTLGRLCAAIGEAGGNIGALDGFDVRGPVLRRSLVVHCRNEEHQHAIVAAVQTRATPGVYAIDKSSRSFTGAVLMTSIFPASCIRKVRSHQSRTVMPSSFCTAATTAF